MSPKPASAAGARRSTASPPPIWAPRASPPAAAAALLLCLLYPVVHATALARGLDPDAPTTLSKVTRTR
jgi:glucosamine--fructose-6-phosphate aminotransferase (isomerizing)